MAAGKQALPPSLLLSSLTNQSRFGSTPQSAPKGVFFYLFFFIKLASSKLACKQQNSKRDVSLHQVIQSLITGSLSQLYAGVFTPRGVLMTAVCGDNMLSEVDSYIKLVCPPFMRLSQAASQITCLFRCGTLVGDLFCGALMSTRVVLSHIAHTFFESPLLVCLLLLF